MKKILLLIILIAGMTQLPSINAQQVKVISFNIRNNKTPKEDGENAWFKRAGAVVHMIEKENPDLFGVQEALLDQLSYIDRNFYRRYRRIGAGADNGLTRGEHNAIYYDKTKYKVISNKTRWLSVTPQRVSIGWDATSYLTAVIIKLREITTGKEICYLNTQLFRDGSISHTESVKLIARLIQEETSSNTMVIIGGSFDSSLDRDDYKPLYDIGMTSARDNAQRTDYRNTFNAFGNARGAMIDHFLVRNIEVKRFKTLNKNYGVKYISDHYPIEIIFNL